MLTAERQAFQDSDCYLADVLNSTCWLHPSDHCKQQLMLVALDTTREITRDQQRKSEKGKPWCCVHTLFTGLTQTSSSGTLTLFLDKLT